MSEITTRVSNPLINGAGSAPARGWLSGVAGKAFALLSAVAIAVPLIGIAQGVGLAPGDMHSNTYMDFGHEVSQLAEHFNAAKEPVDTGIVLLQLTGFKESWSGGYSYRDNKLADSEIGFIEGTAALATAAVAGAAGSQFGNSARRKIDRLNEAVTAKIDARYDELYQLEQERLIRSVSRYYREGDQLAPDNLGKLAAIEDKDLATLPAGAKIQVYQAQRDIALAALQDHGLSKKVDFSVAGDSNLAAMDSPAKAEIFRLQRDSAWNIVNHNLDMQDMQVKDGRGRTTSLAAGFTGGLVLGNRNAAAGAGLAIMALVVSAAVGGAAYLSGKSVYDNFFRDHPELKEYAEPGRPELLTVSGDIEQARYKLGVVPMATGPVAQIPGGMA